MDVMFSSERQTWETPWSFFRALDAEFHFTLDVAASAENTKCARFLSVEENGLGADWGREVCFCNPPYGKKLTGLWIEKAWLAWQSGATVVCLVPARTDTEWFHRYCLGQAEVRFIKGRLRFVGAQHAAPFPSMLVIFRG
jgi:phage N-6-adenine-methyltransferase